MLCLNTVSLTHLDIFTAIILYLNTLICLEIVLAASFKSLKDSKTEDRSILIQRLVDCMILRNFELLSSNLL